MWACSEIKAIYAAAIKRLSTAINMLRISPVIDIENQGAAEGQTRPQAHYMSCYFTLLITAIQGPLQGSRQALPHSPIPCSDTHMTASQAHLHTVKS